MKKSRRGHKWRTTKRYEKIHKGFKWRVYSILPICIFFAYCVLKNGIILFKELTLIFRAKPDVGRIYEQQQKKTRLDQGKIFIIRNTRTRTHGNLTRIGRTCQTLGKERHNIEFDIIRKHQHLQTYQAMNEFGRHAFYIELLEDYPRQKREELPKKEGEKSKERQSGLDKVINGRNQRIQRRQQGTNWNISKVIPPKY